MIYSKFYYGFEVTSGNNLLNFDEGGPELTATITIGSYTATDFVEAVENALNAAGALTYTVTFNRTTRLITIAATGNFDLLAGTGSNKAFGPWTLLGFATDQTGAATYTGGAVAGSEYVVQFPLQDYIASTNWTQAANATVNKTASGRVEVVRFGSESFMQCNFRYITNITQPSGGPITSDASGVTKFRSFASFLITKGPVEFMYDKDTPATFEEMILESTPDNKDGVGYKLKEQYDRGLPGYYDSGVFVFRVVE
jgi:hypothetical protein